MSASPPPALRQGVLRGLCASPLSAKAALPRSRSSPGMGPALQPRAACSPGPVTPGPRRGRPLAAGCARGASGSPAHSERGCSEAPQAARRAPSPGRDPLFSGRSPAEGESRARGARKDETAEPRTRTRSPAAQEQTEGMESSSRFESRLVQ
ncbi:PREDICTED: EP300-interacting inhibitor of differentiation 2-like isoform X2 [Chinchilla lanigera]|uniref:EP300-interacting inhibitor of differentiation 2-like isoform X2 n=1 Tax=Chinchilla lanigera TaxID=34839 RepID=UPI000697311D|nr:PREDICTED: EP300-interacting inhibitor of differentiation 2-like isoform X2 [Chinchilla lanigera]